MSTEFIVIAVVVVVLALVLAWKFSARFRAKVGPYVDKDKNGRPFQ